MAKAISTLEWCVVRLGEDHNWWVVETSDPVRWDVDGLSIIDPRQVAHLIDLVEALRDYGFDQDLMERAFICFRIDKDLGNGKVRLKRTKDSVFESEEKLFVLPDALDEENGPYADLLDHLTRCRVKMLNDLFEFESKLTVDEVEDALREEQNSYFIMGKAVHSFEEITSILDFMPAGYETEDEPPAKNLDAESDDLPELDEAEEEKLKNDESLKWDEDDEDKDDDEPKKDDDEKEEDEEKDTADEDEKPRGRARGKR